MIDKFFDEAPCGYFSFYDDGTIFLVNETLGTILNYDKEELTGVNIEKIFTLSTRIFFQTHLFPLVKMHGHAEEIFLTLLSSDGDHLPVLLNAKRIEWEQRILTGCAFIVVPNRKKFEDELVTARNEAQKALLQNSTLQKVKEELEQQTKKLEQQMRIVRNQHNELQQFSHVVTHNLKEPLRKIMMYTDKLQHESELPVINNLVRSTNQMKAVITGLQQYVWLNEKETQIKKINLRAIIKNAEGLLQNDLGEDLLNIEYNQELSFEGDEEQLELMFYHLFSNAVKFRKENTKAFVTIHTTLLKQNSFRELAGKYAYQDFLKLDVKDEGIGFDSGYEEHIFELFKKLQSDASQGLGLAICKKIVNNHNGKIEAASQPGTSTTITVWLPLVQRN